MATSQSEGVRDVRSTCATILRSRALRIGGSVAGIGLLVRGVDLRTAAADLRHADTRWLLVAQALTAVAFLASVLEWGVLLRSRARGVSWGSVSSWQAQSVFFGHVAPTAAAGDAVRVLNATRVAGGGPGLATLLGSRMAASLGMAMWGLAGAVMLRAVFGIPTLAVAAGFAFLMIVAWIMALGAAGTVHRLSDHRCRVRRRLARIVRPLTDGFHALRGDWQALVKSILVGGVGWGLNLLALHAFGRALGVDVPIALFAVAVPVSLLATLSPVSINGVGLREGVMVGLLGHAGVDAQHAGALTVLIDVQMLPLALTGAVLWLMSRGPGPAKADPVGGHPPGR